jgi:hypothetical protein
MLQDTQRNFKQASLICTIEDDKVTMASIDEMKRVYKANLKVVLYCHEPLMR